MVCVEVQWPHGWCASIMASWLVHSSRKADLKVQSIHTSQCISPVNVPREPNPRIKGQAKMIINHDGLLVGVQA